MCKKPPLLVASVPVLPTLVSCAAYSLNIIGLPQEITITNLNSLSNHRKCRIAKINYCEIFQKLMNRNNWGFC